MMITGSEFDWYILATQPRTEIKVEKGLDRRGIMRFVPRYTKVMKQHGEWKFVERMLIPGYALVAFEPGRERWQAVRETPGVLGFVQGQDRVPWRIRPATDVTDLMSKCSFGHFDDDQRRIGAAVEFSTVKIGPLVSIETKRGRIVSLERNGMVRVLLSGPGTPCFGKMYLDEISPVHHP